MPGDQDRCPVSLRAPAKYNQLLRIEAELGARRDAELPSFAMPVRQGDDSARSPRKKSAAAFLSALAASAAFTVLLALLR